MNAKTKIIVAAVAIVVLLVAGTRFRSMLHKAAPAQQTMNPYASYSPPGGAMPDMSKITGDQATVFKLMTQYGLGVDTAAHLAQAKAQVLSQSNTSVHFVLTLPEGVTSDGTITITPDVKYTPTPAELEQAAKSGTHTYNVKFTIKKESDTKVRMILQYFVPDSAIPSELRQMIQGQSSAVRMFELVPSAWAQEGGGEGGGMSVTEETGLEVAKTVLTEQAEEEGRDLSKEFPKPLEALMDVLKAFKKEQEHFGWLNELEDLQYCAQNPTNPLTKKAFEQDPSYRDQVVHGVTQARGDVAGFTGMRFLNLGVSVAIGEESGPLGVMIGPVGSWTDETLKGLAEQRITDAQKNVTPCDNLHMTTGQFRPAKGTLEYKYNKSATGGADPNTSEKGTSTRDEVRNAIGAFHLAPDPTSQFMGGDGKATLQINTNGSTKTTCESKSHSSLKGPLSISAQAGGSPTAGWLRLIISGDNLTGDDEVTTTCGQGGTSHNHWTNGGFSTSCEFNSVDFVHGGTYSSFTPEDAHGTCTVEISPP